MSVLDKLARHNAGITVRSLLLTILISELFLSGVMQSGNYSKLAYAADGDPTYQVMINPTRLQEGFNTTITVETLGATANTTLSVNVTDPSGVSFERLLAVTINATGFGSSSTHYWANFTGAYTKYVGLYAIAVNGTLANGNFTVGLTDKSQYRRSETVHIRAVGYYPRENVTMSLNRSTTSVSGYPKSLTADQSGVLTDTWVIPGDVTPGNYTLSLMSVTPSPYRTVKTPQDKDTFVVLGAVCSVKTENLANQPVANAVVKVYNGATSQFLNIQQSTNSSGWARFTLNLGNYTFKVLFNNVEVGEANKTVTADVEFTIRLQLTNAVAIAKTEGGELVPFIDVVLKYNSPTVASTLQTNISGTGEARNLFTNTTYLVEAKRYEMLFSNTTLTVPVLPTSASSIAVTLPTYTLNVHALDSVKASAAGVQVRVYDWSSGVALSSQSDDTDTNGDVSFSLPFGRYRLRAYEGDVLLNESVVDLFQNQLAFTLDLATANVDVTVNVRDFFGLPMANAEVKIERKIDQEYVLVKTQSTGASGSTTFTSIVGGECRLSIYVNGRLSDVVVQFLGAGSNQVTISIAEYVALFGYPVLTGLFVFVSFIIVLIVILLVLMRGRLASFVRKREA